MAAVLNKRKRFWGWSDRASFLFSGFWMLVCDMCTFAVLNKTRQCHICTAHALHSLPVAFCFERFMKSSYSKCSFNEITLYKVLTAVCCKLTWGGMFSDSARYEVNRVKTAWWNKTRLSFHFSSCQAGQANGAVHSTSLHGSSSSGW